MAGLSVVSNSKLEDKNYKPTVLKFKQRDAISPASISLKSLGLTIMQACIFFQKFNQFSPVAVFSIVDFVQSKKANIILCAINLKCTHFLQLCTAK